MIPLVKVEGTIEEIARLFSDAQPKGRKSSISPKPAKKALLLSLKHANLPSTTYS